MSSRLIDARYPDFQAVIPTNNENEVIVNRIDLLNSLKRVSIFSNKTTNALVFAVEGNALSVSCFDLDFSNDAKESLDCKHNGEDIEIGFNAKYLIEILNKLQGEEVIFSIGSDKNPALIKGSEDNVTMLVMPIMITAPQPA